jgi:chromosome segregation ATPase
MNYKAAHAHLVYIPDALFQETKIRVESNPSCSSATSLPAMNVVPATARLHKDLEERIKQITELEYEIQQLRFQAETNGDGNLAELEDEIDELMAENSQLKRTLETCQVENQRTKESLKSIQTKVKESELRSRKESDQLRQENSSLKSKYQELDSESQSMRKRLAAIKTYTFYMYLNE